MERNRLAEEKSPYLLQHATNPVDWFPWGEEAFQRARELDRPVFLSIGYSTCHWCHVMERESFEDPSVARLMNDAFINIKVDREERPDIDHLYMNVCQLVTGGGGWPLTIMMTPEKRPFFAATYIPKEDRFGRVGMLNLIPQVVDIWRTRRDEIESSAGRIIDSLRTMEMAPAGETPGRDLIEEAVAHLRARFDTANGGFGSAPKFPSPHNLLFLLRHWKRTGDGELLSMVEKTLDSMRLGGMYDHVGFGFHRYSTDAAWHLPHFEKMLYDQALLLLAYTEGYQATGHGRYRRTAEEIIAYIAREMTGPAGGFYSAEDADSEGVEGKFYVWSTAELREILDDEEYEMVTDLFGISEQGNYLDEATRESGGMNIFHRVSTFERYARKRELESDQVINRWNEARRRLFEVRERRIRPLRDDKILTDWNGLMIAALARAARVFKEPAYSERATVAARFVLDTMSIAEGKLLHRFREDEAAVEGHLDDYAFFIWGMLELYRTTFDTAWLEEALRFAASCREQFRDEERGGFFFTAAGTEELPVRSRQLYDGAIPSGNSVMIHNLGLLARLTGDAGLERQAERCARAFSQVLRSAPGGHTFFLAGVDYLLGPAREVVVVEGAGGGAAEGMLDALDGRYLPHTAVLRKRSGEEERLAGVAPFTARLEAVQGKATAYICSNNTCGLPITDMEAMLAALT